MVERNLFLIAWINFRLTSLTKPVHSQIKYFTKGQEKTSLMTIFKFDVSDGSTELILIANIILPLTSLTKPDFTVWP